MSRWNDKLSVDNNRTRYKEYQYRIFKIDNQYLYYFDENDSWCREELQPREYPACLQVPIKNCNEVKQRNAIERLRVGETYERFKELYEIESKEWNLPMGLDRFIGNIEVIMERETGNINPSTFDFVRVHVYTTYEPDEGKKAYIKNNIDAINRYVIEKLANHRSFKKYGVPVNILKVSNITITAKEDIVYMFEIKHFE